jgi:hypothetical protein
MLTYFISGSNGYTLRAAQTTSNAFTMSLQDMTRLTNTTASLTNITYNNCESMLSFTASITDSVIAEEYRASIINGTTINQYTKHRMMGLYQILLQTNM